MSSFYPYNPWVEAAQMVGDTAQGFGSALVQMPRERYLVAQAQADNALRMQQLRSDEAWRGQQRTWQTEERPLQLQLLQAQLDQAKQMPGIQHERLQLAQERLQQQSDLANSVMALNQARADHLANSTVKPPTPAEQSRIFDTMQKDVIPTVLSRAGVPPQLNSKGEAVGPSAYPVDASQVGSYGSGLLSQGAQVEDVINQLQAVPTLQTNQTWGGWGSPEVVTNKMTLVPRQQQPQANVGQYAQPKTQEEYDKLAPGTVYIDTDGQTKRKK